MLVEGDHMWCVGGAEDMAAMTAVVAAQKEAERGAAGGRITAGGSRVGLWLSAWELFRRVV
jgi:hypothetical protein